MARQLQIGYQYNYGEGVPASAAEAVRWYTKAAALGDATAQANLGDMLEHGAGAPGNWVEAARWYARSAAQDNATGLFRLDRVDRYEAYQAWVLRRNEHDDCKRASRSSCSDPGPAPQ